MNDSDEYEFRKFIAILYMLCGNSEREKIDALIQLYDYGDNK